jgi:hypothetical protein
MLRQNLENRKNYRKCRILNGKVGIKMTEISEKINIILHFHYGRRDYVENNT